MPLYTIKVKWGKELFPNVEVNTDEEPMLFKAQLFALTGVQPERQKVMLKGTSLKDEDWGNMKLKDGVTVLMMGSKEEDVPIEPTEKPLFLEDMNESELATALDLPAGLTNLGNTCYLNATVQCLKTVPELREALKKFSGGLATAGSSSLVPAQSITAALRDLYETMDKGSSLPPLVLVQTLHLAFPRFAEKSEHGGFQQQDASECWTELVRMLQQKLPAKDGALTSEDGAQSSSKQRSVIEQYFGGTFDTELKCVESEDEPPTKGKEDFLQLSCFISTDVKYMHSGLRSKMQEQITKLSPTLNRDAVYTKTSKISRLPAYLTVQFVRFYYKEKEAINAKILKDVKFPLDFDAFELCSSELQSKLTPMRDRFKEHEDSLLEEQRSVKDKKDMGDSIKKNVKQEPYWFADDLGSNNSGYYTLQAVLTHRGRSSSSGHYVAWVRQKGETWLKCDDDVVSAVTSEDVLKLSGGGDWHCAYVLLYGPRILETPIPESN
ncbi:ubiquitin carboxyl-terminal hydrolase 14 [Neodiprion pinetum]|uniref:Ubiquitin carboxyl-terminal hydrolase n=1 Tax=Neodiprion lecontei TaxID=441921 RepID=A0A6J0BQF2_NEOLC|nr:ubiquitin carboxyl-terminal hydrolase 14 [Neodiprion lecontei]XP_046484397.1 ubiquitin carboxyl-terminal hydrolase 14 [Neodiprion pinetum]